MTLPTCDVDEERVLTLVKALFAEVTALFTKVMINQFRKDLLTAMRDHKSQALRSEVGPRKKTKDCKAKT